MDLKKKLLQFDYVLIVIILCIFVLGMIAIASATDFQNLGMTRQVKLQMISFGLGMACVVILLWMNYEIFQALYWWLYAAAIGLLLLVYIPGLGRTLFDARSWIQIGSVHFQTSEISKILYILFLAQFIDKMGGVQRFYDLVKCALPLIPILALLLKQPDLGTALVFVSITFGMVLVNGMRYWHFGVSLAGFSALMPLIYPRLKPHQRNRIDAFLHPDDLSLPGNYHVRQSKITIGSGQMYGKGLFQGVYHQLNYLPVRESDFIFAVFVEETGYVGGMILLALYLIFLLKLLAMSRHTRDNYGSTVIIGVLFMFLFQIVENIAMTMGAMPVTGITLPFFSYGATSVLSGLIAVGVVESIYIRRKRMTFHL